MINIILLILLSSSSTCLFVQIAPPSTECFLMTIFPKQNLLLQIETNIFQERMNLTLQVIRGGKIQYQKIITKTEDKITVKFKQQNQKDLQVQTCLIAKAQENLDLNYLISLKQFRNFDHLIAEESEQREKSTKNVKIKEINELSQKISSVYQEQIQIFHGNQAEESETQQELLNMKNSSFFYSIIQTALIVGFTIVEVFLISKYI